MFSKFSMTSLVLTVLSALVTLIGNMIEQKQIQTEIQEQIQEALDQKNKEK